MFSSFPTLNGPNFDLALSSRSDLVGHCRKECRRGTYNCERPLYWLRLLSYTMYDERESISINAIASFRYVLRWQKKKKRHGTLKKRVH